MSIGEHWLEMKTQCRDTARGVSQVRAMGFFLPCRKRDGPRGSKGSVLFAKLSWSTSRCDSAAIHELGRGRDQAGELDGTDSHCSLPAMMRTCASTRGDSEDRICQHSVSEHEKNKIKRGASTAFAKWYREPKKSMAVKKHLCGVGAGAGAAVLGLGC